MKTKYLFPNLLVAFLLLFTISNYQVYGQALIDAPKRQQDIQYSCPMHPEIIQATAGNCPKCGMRLVDKKYVPDEEIQPPTDTSKPKKDKMKMMNDTTVIIHGQLMPASNTLKN